MIYIYDRDIEQHFTKFRLGPCFPVAHDVGQTFSLQDLRHHLG